MPELYQGRLECAYARGNKREAPDIVVQMLAAKDRPPEPITLDSHVAEVFDVRLANTLEQNGFCTLRDFEGITEEELRSIWNIGKKQIEEIRGTLRGICPIKDNFGYSS